ncbi:DNA polymerase theta-like [Panonychus citri]|uniref:DNA polymerase theta-like n=1 Tax=Panonychus citri TaxID=50023 RepID=UPI00230763C1|nr:DNA polymerase theta-like [Panonychus citri]
MNLIIIQMCTVSNGEVKLVLKTNCCFENPFPVESKCLETDDQFRKINPTNDAIIESTCCLPWEPRQNTNPMIPVTDLDPRFLQKRALSDSHIYDASTKVHVRFYFALALSELVKEMPLRKVAEKFGIPRGELQSIQQNAAAFAGIITTFCQRLGYTNLGLIIGQYQDRLQFGVQRELVDLMGISVLTVDIARHLYKSGYVNVAALANSEVNQIERVLSDAEPFRMENESGSEHRKIWIGGAARFIDNHELAKLIVEESRKIITEFVGVRVEWGQYP